MIKTEFETRNFIEGVEPASLEPSYWRFLRGEGVSFANLKKEGSLYGLAVSQLVNQGLALISLEDNDQVRLLDTKKQWEEADSLTSAELNQLLARGDCADLISEALIRTNTSGTRFLGRLMGQEFGFLGFRDAFQEDRDVHLGPLFEGTEGSIDFDFNSIAYLAENPHSPKRQIFNFHVHTSLWPEICRELLGGQGLPGEENFFSDRDMGWFYQNTRQNPGLIMALGTEQQGKGKLVAISFGSYSAYVGFNHQDVYNNSIQKHALGQDPFDAYREAGLSVETFEIDLGRKYVVRESLSAFVPGG